jgi:hypothetical protein
MSNHPSRSRAQRYGVARTHARPYRKGRGHGTATPDPWRNAEKRRNRGYWSNVRDGMLARLGIKTGDES